MVTLGVNIDHVATLRQARGVHYPNLIEAALVCQDAGAGSIVAHLREDRRHIQDTDIYDLKKQLSIPLNLEMSVHTSVIDVALKAKPKNVTLVPEKREEKTTESGLNVSCMKKELAVVTQQMHDAGIGVSLFLDPILEYIDFAKACGVDAVEIHTGTYANSAADEMRCAEIGRIQQAIERANQLGLLAHVGHGLDYTNVEAIAFLEGIHEFNIGFSIISRAVFVGLKIAVEEMRFLISTNPRTE